MQLTVVTCAQQPVLTSCCRLAAMFWSFPSRAISRDSGISPHGFSSLAGRRPGASLRRRGPFCPCMSGPPSSCVLAVPWLTVLSLGEALHFLNFSYWFRRDRVPGNKPPTPTGVRTGCALHVPHPHHAGLSRSPVPAPLSRSRRGDRPCTPACPPVPRPAWSGAWGAQEPAWAAPGCGGRPSWRCVVTTLWPGVGACSGSPGWRGGEGPGGCGIRTEDGGGTALRVP